MKLIKNITIFSMVVFSLSALASINEITSITLNNSEVIVPHHDILQVNDKSIDLFDGRRIGTSEIKKIEINDSNGDSKTISKGLFKLISIESAHVSGGDATGGG
jgi:hypothetical protein